MTTRSGPCSSSPPPSPVGGGELVKAGALADSQGIPLSFLRGILVDLCRAGLLVSHRGSVDRTTLADLLRAGHRPAGAEQSHPG
ncbi:hypothetical protein [Micromonospora sp. KLBMP9576]|uniref:hypothetical protein n=1 Tax=Micromonospora sp. KLBMP9576 TaxID=3424769 RepID=UPI003D8F1A80